MNQGIYEELVTKLINYKLNELDKNTFQIKKTPIDKAEASQILSLHISKTIKQAFNLIKGENVLENQIDIANKIILFLKEELKKEEFEDDLIETEGKILKAVFTKVDSHFTDLDLHLKEITPYTRLIHSELFTGGNSGTTLESELRKEILSSPRKIQKVPGAIRSGCRRYVALIHQLILLMTKHMLFTITMHLIINHCTMVTVLFVCMNLILMR